MTDFQTRRYLDDLADSIKRRCRDPEADPQTIAASARQSLDLLNNDRPADKLWPKLEKSSRNVLSF